jgi:hypothetical protein
MSSIDPFLGEKAFRRALGDPSKIKFWQMLRDGEVPPPDGYLGPRLPVWKQSTAIRTQEQILARPRPVEKPRGGGWKHRKAQGEAQLSVQK